MITLYQFSISHFCEIARWALEYKELPYATKNLLPGLHVKQLRAVTSNSNVPVLVDNDTVIQGSSNIIDYLDRQYPQKPLTLTDPVHQKECQEWETFLGDNLGVTVRAYCYSTLLEHPKIIKPMLTHNGPWWSPLYIGFIFPKLKALMIKKMQINEASIKAAEKKIVLSLEKIQSRLKDHEFLVGESFSRADIVAASLSAPLFNPNKYGTRWPKDLPEALSKIQRENGDLIAFAEQRYNHFR